MDKRLSLHEMVAEIAPEQSIAVGRGGLQRKPIAAAITTTPEPTTEEPRIIREVIDPLGMRRLESKAATEELMLEIWRSDPRSARGWTGNG